MIQYHYSIHICIPKKIRTPSVDASKVFYEDSVIWRNMDTEIYIFYDGVIDII